MKLLSRLNINFCDKIKTKKRISFYLVVIFICSFISNALYADIIVKFPDKTKKTYKTKVINSCSYFSLQQVGAILMQGDKFIINDNIVSAETKVISVLPICFFLKYQEYGYKKTIQLLRPIIKQGNTYYIPANNFIHSCLETEVIEGEFSNKYLVFDSKTIAENETYGNEIYTDYMKIPKMFGNPNPTKVKEKSVEYQSEDYKPIIDNFTTKILQEELSHVKPDYNELLKKRYLHKNKNKGAPPNVYQIPEEIKK